MPGNTSDLRFAIRTGQISASKGLPLLLGRGVCETKSKNGRSRPRKPFISRVFCAQRWKGPDHGVGVNPETVQLVRLRALSFCDWSCEPWPHLETNLASHCSPELLESPRTSPEVPRTSPEVFGDFPGSSLTVELNSNPEVPRKFPRLPRKFPGLPRKFPGPPRRSAVSLGSLTPSSD